MRKQQGMTLIGMLCVVITVICVGIVALRIAPVYIQNYEVRSSIDALKQLDSSIFSSDSMANAAILRNRLMKQFDINGFTEYKPEQISAIPNGRGGFLVGIKYTIIRPLVYNISLMFEFNEAVEISAGSN